MCIAFVAVAAATSRARADEVTGAVYVRADTDHTVVVSPRVHALTQVGETTQLDLTYAADVWTSASVDIRASASLPVTEQRNELDIALAHAFGDLTLNVNYRYSVENDYSSHGVTAGGTLDLAEKNTTLALSAYVFDDAVGRAGDSTFSRSVTTAGARASITQVFDPDMFGQLAYEPSYVHGYQASPYRFVGLGPSATGFGCAGALTCVRERVPGERLRHALVALLRRALSDSISLGLDYRFYLDDWHLDSHTLEAQLAWLIDENTQLALHYRFYVQSKVWFYQRTYHDLAQPPAFVTRDREQSPMTSQRIGLEFRSKTNLNDPTSRLIASVTLAGTLYSYSEFVGLERVYALELTLALSLGK